MGQPRPWGGGPVLSYENVKIAIDEGVVNVTVDTGKNEVGTQISRETGQVIGGSNAPKEG
jgi:hypothetical protein